jgi:FMN phosphatase YigB (HAD superfamily)
MIKAAIFDYGQTIHDPDSDQLFPNVTDVIEYLKKNNIKLALVSRTEDVEGRHKNIKRLGLDKHFDLIKVFPVHIAKNFSEVLDNLKVLPHETLVIGDRIKSEITEGNKVGATTIWLRHGKWHDEEPENEKEKPVHTIHSMKELLELLPSLT